MFDGALSEFAIGELAGEGVPVFPPQPETQRFATHSFATGADDTPAHTSIRGRIAGTFVLRREIAGGSEGRFGALIRASADSELILANGDRELDDLLGGYLDGRPVRLKIGTITTTSLGERVMPRYDELQLALTASAGSFSADRDTVRLRLRDQGLLLQRDVQTQVYTGGGGREGGAALVGRSKPLAHGKCRNVPAQIVDETILTYQVSTIPLTSLSVYDAGVTVPLNSGTSDYATYNEMIAADCRPGRFVSCLAEGFFRLAVEPSGQVTADTFTGIFSTAGIIDQLLLYAGIGAADRAIGQIASAAEDFAGYFQPAGSNASVEAACVELAAAAGAVFGADRSGIYRLVWLDSAVFTQVPDFSFDEGDVVDAERVPLPYGVPWLSWVVGSERNWSPQSSDELALSVEQSRRQFLEREFRAVRTQDPEVRIRYLTSRETDLIPTFYSTTQPAIRFANRMAAWYGLDQAMYRVTVKTALGRVEIGDIIELTLPYWGLDAGLSFMVVSVSDDLAAVETELLLFGAQPVAVLGPQAVVRSVYGASYGEASYGE